MQSNELMNWLTRISRYLREYLDKSAGKCLWKINLSEPVEPTRLRRDLGTLESYATLIGILIGAGIFQVTSQAWAMTGPSVILGYLVLTPAILATSIPYAAYLSTPLGREPGGEYLHISRTVERISSRVRRLVAQDHFLHRRRRLSRQCDGRISDRFERRSHRRANGFSCRSHSLPGPVLS